jgi:hypothetical protein
MTASSLPALRATAEGRYTLEAAVGLFITHGTWLARDDLARFIYCGTGTAAIDWEPLSRPGRRPPLSPVSCGASGHAGDSDLPLPACG